MLFNEIPRTILVHIFDNIANITPDRDKTPNTSKKIPGYLIFSFIKKDRMIHIPTIKSESLPYLFTSYPP